MQCDDDCFLLFIYLINLLSKLYDVLHFEMFG